MRPEQGPQPLRAAVGYLADEGAEKLLLAPLTETAVAEVASDVMWAEPDEALLRMAGEAGGNPFLLVELLEGLRQEGLVSVESGRKRRSPFTAFPTASARACGSALPGCRSPPVRWPPSPGRWVVSSPSPI